MPVYLLNENLEFPPANNAQEDGLLAVGGDLSAPRLLLAYENGIFPWFSENDPILWWSPDPRCVLYPSSIKISKSMRNILNRKELEVTYDKEFVEVIGKCRQIRRKESGTWINDEMQEAYCILHDLGIAHSIEVWQGNDIVGGLYGVSLGRVFFGESMFSEVPNASKVALIHLANNLAKLEFGLIDCQIYNPHLGRMGAVNIGRDLFLKLLNDNLKRNTLKGNWGRMKEFGMIE